MANKEKTLRELNDEWLKANNLKPPEDNFVPFMMGVGAIVGIPAFIALILYCLYLAFFG